MEGKDAEGKRRWYDLCVFLYVIQHIFSRWHLASKLTVTFGLTLPTSELSHSWIPDSTLTDEVFLFKLF